MAMSKMHTSVDRVMEDHRELRRRLDELCAFLEVPRPECGELGSHEWASCLARHLIELHARVSSHFQEEEASGALEEVARQVPRVAADLERLTSEHGTILDGLRSLLDDVLLYAEKRPVGHPELRRRVQATLDHLARHEAEETDILQRAWYEDLGYGGY